MNGATPVAGWYQDPYDAGQYRWWDGTAWTQTTAAPEPADALVGEEPAQEPPPPEVASPDANSSDLAPLPATSVVDPGPQLGDVVNGYVLTSSGWTPVTPMVPHPVATTPPATTPLVYAPRRGADPVHVVIAWVCTVFTGGYFLPWAIAATRGKSNTLSIALINFLLGWTVIGWIVALVMACMAEPKVPVVQQSQHQTVVVYGSPPTLPPQS